MAQKVSIKFHRSNFHVPSTAHHHSPTSRRFSSAFHRHFSRDSRPFSCHLFRHRSNARVEKFFFFCSISSAVRNGEVKKRIPRFPFFRWNRGTFSTKKDDSVVTSDPSKFDEWMRRTVDRHFSGAMNFFLAPTFRYLAALRSEILIKEKKKANFLNDTKVSIAVFTIRRTHISCSLPSHIIRIYKSGI